MENFETILYLLATAEVITLICFFVLCSNVSSIKQRIGGTEFTRIKKIDSFILAGQTDRAKDLLVEMMMYEPEWVFISYYRNEKEMNQSRERLEKKYKAYLDVLNIKLDWGALDKIRKEE